jgi:hypothetical protein
VQYKFVRRRTNFPKVELQHPSRFGFSVFGSALQFDSCTSPSSLPATISSQNLHHHLCTSRSHAEKVYLISPLYSEASMIVRTDVALCHLVVLLGPWAGLLLPDLNPLDAPLSRCGNTPYLPLLQGLLARTVQSRARSIKSLALSLTV